MDDKTIYPFFNDEEVKQNGLILMMLAQDALFERMNAMLDEGKKLSDETFLAVIESSPNLQEILRDAVSTGINHIDWHTCHDIAVAHSIKRDEDEATMRRERIKML